MFRQLTKGESLTLMLGSALMVLGVVMYLSWQPKAASVVFVLGAFAFALMQLRQRYEGSDVTLLRLRKILSVTDFFFCLSSLLMLENAWHLVFPFFLKFGTSGYNAYLQFVHNNWVVVLLVAAILELYATHRIAKELKKGGQQ